MKLAIFDIDGVLVRRSTERAFWRYLARHGRQGPRQISAFIFCLLRYFPVAGIRVAKQDKAYLCGLSRADIETLGRQFIGDWAADNWYPPALARLERHRSRGDRVVMLSGTLELLARPLAHALGVRHVFATVPSERDGIFQASLPVVHPFGVSKLEIADKLVREHGFDWQSVAAYGDSHHDRYLLEAVGEPVAVRPDVRLRRAALARGWEIIDGENEGLARAEAENVRRG